MENSNDSDKPKKVDVPWPFPKTLITHSRAAPPPEKDSPATYDDLITELGEPPC
jgi:hypothetical protein